VLSLGQISLRIGTRTLLEKVSWKLGTGERIALVGRNGAGKTTLFRIALGEQSPDEGVVERAHHVRLGYLPQEELPLEGATPLDGALKAFDSALDAAREQQELHDEIAELSALPPDDPRHEELPALLARVADLEHAFEQGGGWSMRSEAERVLDGLGFSAEQMRAPLSTLSGGWRMRVHLARLLLSRPTHLFLDEPTNHLDLPSLAWLEEFLREFSGTLVVISHDRAFLDRTVTKVVELEGGTLAPYAGNYTAYEAEKAQRRKALENAKLNQERKIVQLERFIERFRAKNTKATQAKSKEKQLAKIERIEIEEDPDSIHFHFDPAPRSGQVVVALAGAAKRFGEGPLLFERLDLGIERGEKIAIVGPNGAGKSTLLRILAGTEPLTAGERRLDPRAALAFFAQHTAESLDLSATVLEEVRKAAPRGTLDLRLRTLLGAFLFQGDDVRKPIRVLSGGEKARVAIAKTLVQPVNCLLLDEPTNHLDLKGKETLAEALVGYDGTLVLVTHDRAVIDAVATRVLEVGPGEDGRGRVKSYLGGFTQYATMRQREGRPLPGYAASGAAVAPSRLERAPAGAPAKAAEPATRKRGEEHRERKREERAKEGLEKKLLARLEALEAEKAGLERDFEDPALYGDASRLAAKRARHAELGKEIAGTWAALEGAGGRP
jgi:ATP-binding cassette subfamily F protein 3